jgi:hypothetical protein
VLDGVLDLRTGLLEVALEPVGVALGAQATAAGEPAGGLLDAALTASALCANFLPILIEGRLSGVILPGRAR